VRQLARLNLFLLLYYVMTGGCSTLWSSLIVGFEQALCLSWRPTPATETAAACARHNSIDVPPPRHIQQPPNRRFVRTRMQCNKPLCLDKCPFTTRRPLVHASSSVPRCLCIQGFLVVVTGELAPGHLDKFLELFKPVVSRMWCTAGEWPGERPLGGGGDFLRVDADGWPVRSRQAVVATWQAQSCTAVAV
jgi:hypothetical protein